MIADTAKIVSTRAAAFPLIHATSSDKDMGHGGVAGGNCRVVGLQLNVTDLCIEITTFRHPREGGDPTVHQSLSCKVGFPPFAGNDG